MVRLLAPFFACWLLLACDATETNVTPAPCLSDEDCPRGVRCMLPDAAVEDGGAVGGFCPVEE